MGCHFPLQRLCPTQGSNPHHLCLLHWQADSLSLCHLGSPESQRQWFVCVCESHSVMFDSSTPQTEACQISLSMEFSRQEYWSGLPFPSPRDLPNPGIKPRSPTLQADSLPSEPPGKPAVVCNQLQNSTAGRDPTSCCLGLGWSSGNPPWGTSSCWDLDPGLSRLLEYQHERDTGP